MQSKLLLWVGFTAGDMTPPSLWLARRNIVARSMTNRIVAKLFRSGQNSDFRDFVSDRTSPCHSLIVTAFASSLA